MHFLITSGPTREYIDPVRFISNASSGRMGCALAQAAIAAGHQVTLITTVEISDLKSQISNLRTVRVETAAEMFEAVKRQFTKCDCLIMAAAVADYAPAKTERAKIKKSKKTLTIRLKPTADILKWAGERNLKSQISNLKFIAGFALEDRNIRKNAEKKLKDKNLDMIIANTPAAIGAQASSIQIKTPSTNWVTLSRSPKNRLARKLVSFIENLFA